MTKTELKQLFLIINNCYSNFQFDDVKIEIWFDLLKDIQFDRAQRNLREHVRTNRFIPTPADIVNETTSQRVDRLFFEQRNLEMKFNQYISEGGDPDSCNWKTGEIMNTEALLQNVEDD